MSGTTVSGSLGHLGPQCRRVDRILDVSEFSVSSSATGGRLASLPYSVINLLSIIQLLSFMTNKVGLFCSW